MKYLLLWITGFLPCRIISDGGKPYLERYYLATIFGTHFYLHRFVASDPDRGLHDHPWRWAFSVILVGWYQEQTRYGLRTVRWFNKLTGDTFHRVILPEATWFPNGPKFPRPEPVWTLFMHRAVRSKEWGFLRAPSLKSMTTSGYHGGYEETMAVPEADADLLYKRHVYRADELGRDEKWWLTAPLGKDSGRLP